MLDFWYSPRCTRQIKLALCVITFAVVYWSSNISKVDTNFACASLLLGLSLHGFYQLSLKTKWRAQRSLLNLMSSCIFLLIIAALIYLLPKNHQAITSLQIIGYSLLGFFSISIYSQRSRRHD